MAEVKNLWSELMNYVSNLEQLHKKIMAIMKQKKYLAKINDGYFFYNEDTFE